MADAQGLRDALDKDGFVVIKTILRPDQLAHLREATSQVIELGRAGQWPHVRTIGKQFPPWSPSDATSHGIWGVQHLMKPSCPSSASFTNVYFSDEILGIAKDLMACEDDDLVMELFNMLVRPDRDFELRWHRDDIDKDATAEEELERLNMPSWHVQYNLPLYEDDSIIVIPGSHRRARTDTERSAGPYDRLPGEKRVQLDPGDIVFYNNNIVHRGAYDSTKERVTLHGSVGHVKGSAHRARNVLQHAVGDWVQDIDLSKLEEKLLKRAQGMRDRLVKLGSESGDVGYSLQG